VRVGMGACVVRWIGRSDMGYRWYATALSSRYNRLYRSNHERGIPEG